jgi:hypothetical protein
VNGFYVILTGPYFPGCPIDVLPGHSEVAVGVIHFDPAIPIPTIGKFTTDEDMHTSSGWRDFGVGVQSVDDIFSPFFEFAGVGITAFVEVDAGDGDILGKHKSEAVGVDATVAVGRNCLLEIPTLVRVGDVQIRAATGPIRFRRDFGRFPVSLPLTPADPVLDRADFFGYFLVSNVDYRHGLSWYCSGAYASVSEA